MTAGAKMIDPSPATAPAYGAPPYLHWPVSRREFYRAIWLAMLPALAWGAAIFGMRAAVIVIAAAAACTLTHVLLKHGLRWKRAQALMYQHSLVSAFVLAGLCHPSWPAGIVAVAAGLLPLMLVFIGGAGREKIHVSVALAIILQQVVATQLPRYGFEPVADAILARDRLFMGDIRNQTRLQPSGWPGSWALGGNDAMVFSPPASVASETLNSAASLMPSRTDDTEWTRVRELQIDSVFSRAFAFALPSMDLFMLGVAPNRIGAASLIAGTLAGLFLSYRYILRPRSVLLFLLVFIGASVMLAFTPMAIHRVGVPAMWELWSHFKPEVLTLICFQFLGSDAAFAAVFILALPGTEPLTPRGRRFFLVLAAVLGAAIHRMDPATPGASLAICVLMPAAPMFDRLLVQRSWLNP